MRRQLWRRGSADLGRDMTVACWGHYGRPTLIFPAAGGDALEAERFGLVEALAPLIEAGRCKLFSCDSVEGAGWLSTSATDEEKLQLQRRFLRWVGAQLCPFVRAECGDTPQRFLAIGCSLGAANALGVGLAFPSFIERVLALSGAYDLRRWLGPDAPARWPELDRLDLNARSELASSRILLTVGDGRFERPAETASLAAALSGLGVPVQTRRIEGAAHDWPSWRRCLPDLVLPLL